MIQVTNGGAELVVVRGGVTSYYTYSSFKSIAWFQANNGNYIVVITFLTDPAGSVPLKLSLNEVDNQPSWTNDVLGAEDAVKAISGWISLAVLPTPGLATEATLLDVLAAVDNMRDYEVRLVVDASDVTWLEVRYWDAQDGTLGTPVYYLAGSTTPGSPVLPITYINPNTYLAQIVTNTSAIAVSTAAIDTSIDVNLSTVATETTLASVLTELQGINLDTNGLSQEATQLLIQALLITIDADTSNLDVALSTVATEVTLASVLLELQGINLDTNGLSQEATQLLIQALLTTIDADTSNLDVALSTVATETTLASLLTAFNLEDFATEATLSAVNTQITSVARTPNFLRPTGALGTITAGTFSMSFASVGTADATVGGMILKPGETINFDAGALNNTLGAVAYSTTTAGAELIIITLT